MKLKPEKECWICHRKLSEVIEAGNKMGYDPIACEDDPKAIERHAMLNVDVLGRKVSVCAICHDIVFEVGIESIKEVIHCGMDDSDDDIVTYKDLENMTLEVDLGDPPSHRNKVKGALASRKTKPSVANESLKKADE
jgi:hypothetical protein